jgi:hypothetical protein
VRNFVVTNIDAFALQQNNFSGENNFPEIS